MSTLFGASGESDVVLHVAVRNSERLHAFLVGRLAARGEVARFQTSMIVGRVHQPVLARSPETA